MRPIVCIFLSLALAPMALAANVDEFSKSRAQWEKINAGHDLLYRYTTSYQSWVGFGQTTSIDVDHDQVVQREFERWRWYYDYEDGNTYKRETIASWVEGSKEIGTHPEGEKPKTLDQVYDECQENVLSLDAERFIIEFNVDDAGLIKTCRARDIYCADDCWEGIAIESLKIKGAKQ